MHVFHGIECALNTADAVEFDELTSISDKAKLPLRGSRPGPKCGSDSCVRASRRKPLMLVSRVATLTVYVSRREMLLLRRSDSSGKIVKVAPLVALAERTFNTDQFAVTSPPLGNPLANEYL